jgi:hypothetical protein
MISLRCTELVTTLRWCRSRVELTYSSTGRPVEAVYFPRAMNLPGGER